MYWHRSRQSHRSRLRVRTVRIVVLHFTVLILIYILNTAIPIALLLRHTIETPATPCGNEVYCENYTGYRVVSKDFFALPAAVNIKTDRMFRYELDHAMPPTTIDYRIDHIHPDPSALRFRYSVIISGWPLDCVSGDSLVASPRPGTSLTTGQTSYLVSLGRLRRDSPEILIPLKPVWSGLLMSTLVVCTVAVLILLIFKRDYLLFSNSNTECCLFCGYPKTLNTICSECGRSF